MYGVASSAWRYHSIRAYIIKPATRSRVVGKWVSLSHVTWSAGNLECVVRFVNKKRGNVEETVWDKTVKYYSPHSCFFFFRREMKLTQEEKKNWLKF